MHFSTLTSVHLSRISIDFSMETITSEAAVNLTHVDQRQKYREKRIEEVFQSEDAVLINNSDGEIFDDEKDVRKVTSFKALDSQDAVKCFAAIQRD